MSVEALTRDSTMDAASGGDDHIKNPPIDGYFPEGDDDDRRNLQAVLDRFETDELEAMMGPQPRSVADGWEERAKDVQPGRGYNFAEVADPHDQDTRILGRIAFFGSVPEGRYTSFGLPGGMRIGQVVSAASFRRV